MNANVLIANQTNPGTHAKKPSRKDDSNGDSHPPKNIMLTSILINIKFIYSAKKNIANAIPEYSTYPAFLRVNYFLKVQTTCDH